MKRYQKFTKNISISMVFLILCSGVLGMMFGAFAGLSVIPENEENISVTFNSSNIVDIDSKIIEDTPEIESIDSNIYSETTTETTKSEEWHPLGTNALNLLEREEIVFLGVDEDDNEDFNGWVWDDQSHSYVQMKRWDNNDGASNPSIAAGDLDGDGAAELVFLGTFEDGDDLKGWVYDDANHNFATLRYWIVTDDHSKEPEIACGDIDGDGLDEIICISVDEDGEDINAWIWDDHNAGYAELKHWDNNDDVRSVNVACGDVDGDFIDEIIFLGTMKTANEDLICWVYDDKTADFTQLWYWYDKDTNSDEPDITCGDIDGDGLDEIVIVSTDCGFLSEADTNGWVWDDAARNFALLKHWDANDNTLHPQIACGDVDGDAKDEIIILGIEKDGEDLKGWVWDDHDAGYAPLHNWNSDDNTESPRVATGDVDLDGKDELLFLGTDKDGEDINGWLWDDKDNGFDLLKQWDANDDTKTPVCVIADIDGDGVVVEYEGHHYEAYAKKTIIAVMAAPPTQAGLSQNYNDSSSSFGSYDGDGSISGGGFYQTFSITSTWKLNIPVVFEVGGGVRLSEAWTRTTTTTTLRTDEVGSSSGYNENKIIYTTPKYDRYVYRVISDTYQDSGLSGTTFTIDIPIEAKTYSETLEYFNAHNGDEPDINIFDHNIGMVDSYPSVGARDIIAPPSDNNEYPLLSRDSNKNPYANPVGQGTGDRWFKIDSSTETTLLNELSLGGELIGEARFGPMQELEISVGGGKIGLWGTTVVSGFYFEGKVGDINDWDEYDSYHYSYGLFIYPREIDYYGDCYVLNYWVQDLGNGYNPITVSYQGYVKNNANYAISNARVDVKKESGTIVATTYTDSNGYFNTINISTILNGNYQLYFSKSGYISKSLSVDADEGSRSYDTSMTASSNIHVDGYVKDTYGYPLGGARIIIKAPNGVVLGIARARSDGYYSISIEKGLAGYYRAVATFIGKSSSTYTISSTSATRRNFTIRLPYVPAPDLPFF